jgi:hypothetical protein
MTYRMTLPEKESQFDYASCFVVETAGQWVVLTAGHVIDALRSAAAAGAVLSDFAFQDQLAGNQFPYGVPFTFDLDRWASIKDRPAEGADFACSVLDPFVIDQLEAGGIRPIESTAWGEPPCTQYDYWILAGIPSESLEQVGTRRMLKLTVIPLKPTLPPFGATATDERLNVFAEIVDQPALDDATVSNIIGMSGGPVFGLKAVDDGLKYWLIGLQSGWYPKPRVVRFCPLHDFLAANEVVAAAAVCHRADG